MQGKIILITGATNGIGKASALALARMGAHVALVGRSPERLDATHTEITGDPAVQRAGGTASSYRADLSRMAEVRELAAAFRADHDRLHVLLNNAGAAFNQRMVTDEGWEMTFALNHLSYFLLTDLLLDVLIHTGQPGARARIINVSSDAHRFGPMRFDDLQFERSNYSMFPAYGQSKLANVLFTTELARRLADKPVTVNALHPGLVATGFGNNNSGIMGRVFKFMQLFARTPEQGAATSIYLASSPDLETVTGAYFVDKKRKTPSPAAQNADDARRLWTISEQMVNPVRA
jgi:NAD(P)-dependent dehydrogenase (short-subunit alcohol dehydrogenase family)